MEPDQQYFVKRYEVKPGLTRFAQTFNNNNIKTLETSRTNNNVFGTRVNTRKRGNTIVVTKQAVDHAVKGW